MSKATQDDLFAFLDELGIKTSTLEHEPMFTVEDSQKLRGELTGAHTKNLFLKDKKGRLYLVTCAESRKINIKALEKALGAARCSFGKPELLEETLGVLPGSVTAFGLINDREEPQKITFALDKALAEADIVNCHPLHNAATTAISSADLLRFVAACGHEAQIIDFDTLDAG